MNAIPSPSESVSAVPHPQALGSPFAGSTGQKSEQFGVPPPSEPWKSQRGRVSYQVLQESCVQAARKSPQSTNAAEAEVRDLLAWDPVVVDAPVIETAWRLHENLAPSYISRRGPAPLSG